MQSENRETRALVSAISSTLVCYWMKSRGIRAKLESILTLQQSLTEHYFLCKDTTVHIYYVEKKHFWK